MKNVKKIFTQKEIWELVVDTIRNWRFFHRNIIYRNALEEAFKIIEDDNSIGIPIEWKQKFRKRLDKALAKKGTI